jgi:type IV pilus assembly protein PilZ
MTARVEQRRFPRVPIDVPVEITSRDSWQKAPGIAKDISLGGTFIETALPAAFGVTVLVAFTFPGQKPMLLPGTVRWTSARGMGVQFGLLGAQETHAITEIERKGKAVGSG